MVASQCLKFATDQQSDLKRMEALNSTFFRLMARGPNATGAAAFHRPNPFQQAPPPPCGPRQIPPTPRVPAGRLGVRDAASI